MSFTEEQARKAGHDAAVAAVIDYAAKAARKGN
jgi:hypothetical protein